MTIKQFIKELELWREERGLTQEGQRQGLLANVLEELGELGAALRNDDKDGVLDAVLDIAVLFINAYEFEVERYEFHFFNNIIKGVETSMNIDNHIVAYVSTTPHTPRLIATILLIT